jgi:hypothetical protein
VAENQAENVECSGICLSGHDVGIPSGGIAYPHPDCPAHGDLWNPHDNEWSRQYVADHPDRAALDQRDAEEPSNG